MSSYLANDLEMARAKKRNPGSELISIDTADVDGRCPIQIGHDTTPERVFERRWALVLLGKALHKLEESYKKRGDEKLFAKMKAQLVGMGAESHRAVAEELGMREETFNVALSRCRSRFQERIREEIAETVVHEDEIEDELRHLHCSLRSR